MRIKLLILLISICQTSFAQLIPFKMGDIVTGIKYGYEDKKAKLLSIQFIKKLLNSKTD